MIDLIIGLRLGVCMELTQEQVVTKLLSNSEILERDYVEEMFEGTKTYQTNPKYDLTHYLNTTKAQPKRFDEKYLFVK